MSSHHLNEQAGLEVVQEPEAPQVVEQPWHWQKQLDPRYGTIPGSKLDGRARITLDSKLTV